MLLDLAAMSHLLVYAFALVFSLISGIQSTSPPCYGPQCSLPRCDPMSVCARVSCITGLPHLCSVNSDCPSGEVCCTSCCGNRVCKDMSVETTVLPPFVTLPPECSLDKETGPCRASFQRYFHNKDTGACETFIYGGCRGNTNNFQTRLACEQRCRAGAAIHVPVEPLPSLCRLPKETGRCRAAITKYYHNADSNRCESFTFGGCGGNSNQFDSLIECETACQPSGCRPIACPQDCGIEIVTESSGCKSCRCLATIAPIGTETLIPMCSGPTICTRQLCSTLPASSVQLQCSSDRDCRADQYCCKECCNRFCRPLDSVQAPQTPQRDPLCSLPKDVGPCRASTRRHFFNSATGACETFVFGGCRGNANKFTSGLECEQACQPEGCRRIDCPMDCGVAFTTDSRGCKTCSCSSGGGGNNPLMFTRPAIISPRLPSCASGLVCPMVVCSSLPSSSRNLQCSQDSDCPSNHLCCTECCNRVCKPSGSTQTIRRDPLCSLPKDVGPCRASTRRHFFNSATGACETFVFGGCRGNANKFTSGLECEQACQPEGCRRIDCPMDCGVAFTTDSRGCKTCSCSSGGGGIFPPTITFPPIDTIPPIISPSLPSCASSLMCPMVVCSSLPSSSRNLQCSEDSDCSSDHYCCKECCNHLCKPRTSTVIATNAVCNLPKVSGNCTGSVANRYYFDVATFRCQRFRFSIRGNQQCSFNKNNFRTLSMCRQACPSGNPGENLPRCPRLESCPSQSCETQSFARNNDRCYSDSDCQRGRFCCKSCCKSVCVSRSTRGTGSRSGSRVTTAVVRVPDCRQVQACFAMLCPQNPPHACSSDDQCSNDEFCCKECCTRRCKPRNPSSSRELCSLPQQPGNCFAFFRKFYYDTQERNCKPFVYGGCGGNGNRFDSLEQCRRRCVGPY